MCSWKITEFKILLRKIRFALIWNSSGRIKYLRKNNVFAFLGENVFFQPRKLPADPKLIKLHNNVCVAADVTFVNHDVIYIMQRNKCGKNVVQNLGCIEVFDNVFIGIGSYIMPNVKIGPNVVIAAGSVITKDVPPNTVVGGVPAKVIGDFDVLMEKRMNLSKEIESRCEEHCGKTDEKRIAYEWDKFYKNRN